MSRNLWTFLEAYIPLSEAFPWIISCIVQWVEQRALEGDLNRFELAEKWASDRRMATIHTWPFHCSSGPDLAGSSHLGGYTSAVPECNMINASGAGTCKREPRCSSPTSPCVWVTSGETEWRKEWLLGTRFLFPHMAVRLPEHATISGVLTHFSSVFF